MQRLLMAAGIAPPILFTGIAAALGHAREGYSQIRQPLSQLGAVGTPHATLQNGNFIIQGGLTIAFALGLQGALGIEPLDQRATLILGTVGVGSIGLGLFPSTTSSSLANGIHLSIAFLTFVTFIISTVVANHAIQKRWQWRRYARYSRLTAITLLPILLLYCWTYIGAPGSGPFTPYSGAMQKLLIGIWVLWLEITAIRISRARSQNRV